MIKNFLKILILIFTLFLLFIGYFAYFGITTSKFNSIIKKYEYLRCTKYFCKTCKELYESGSRRICECHIPQESSESEESNESEESSESEDQDSSSNWETDNNDYNIGPLSLDEESSEDSSSGRGGLELALYNVINQR